jgi:hypothetical protein
MTDNKETRVIECLMPGFEGSYTQYTIVRTHVIKGVPQGDLYIVQVALHDNTARALLDPEPIHRWGTVGYLRDLVEQLIANRTEDGHHRELTE